MHTRSWRPSFRSLSLPGLALLPLLIAAVVLAVTASESPPAAPAFPADSPTNPTGGVFVFSASAGTATIRFSAVAPRPPETIGYRLYVGSTARSAGAPYNLGNTPCDLGTATTAGIQTCASVAATQSVHLAVTAYNEYGNEGDYSQPKIFVPVSPPTITAVTPGASNSRQIGLTWTRGTAPANIAGVVVETEIFRRLAATGAYTKLNIPSNATSFTDTNLEKDSSYEYTFRSKATPPAVDGSSPAIITYSAVAAAQIRSARTAADVFDLTVFGTNVNSNPVDVTDLVAGDRVVINGISGQVIFNTSPTCGAPGAYNVTANGLDRNTYESPANALCYTNDRSCTDPFSSGPHAGLYMKRGSTATFIGTGGSTFDVTGSQALTLVVNDCSPGNPAPNTGDFDVRVTVTRP